MAEKVPAPRKSEEKGDPTDDQRKTKRKQQTDSESDRSAAVIVDSGSEWRGEGVDEEREEARWGDRQQRGGRDSGKGNSGPLLPRSRTRTVAQR
jgi:hypothetical protein